MGTDNDMITLAITTYNRVELTLRAFRNVMDDSRIDEILIYDDASDEAIWNKLYKELRRIDNGKIQIVRDKENVGCYKAKREAVECARHEWIILFDSDNVIYPSYLDALDVYCPKLTEDIIYAPSFARPHFDYRNFARQLK